MKRFFLLLAGFLALCSSRPARAQMLPPNIQGPSFPVYVIYQMASTNRSKFSFPEFTNECSPIVRYYKEETIVVNKTSSLNAAENCTTTSSNDALVHER